MMGFDLLTLGSGSASKALKAGNTVVKRSDQEIVEQTAKMGVKRDCGTACQKGW